MSDTKRTLIAGFAVAFLFLCMPFYLQFIGVAPDSPAADDPAVVEGDYNNSFEDEKLKEDNNKNILKSPPSSFVDAQKISFSVVTEKAEVVLSNFGGGSLSSFTIVDKGDDFYKYLGGYNEVDEYQDDINVSLVLNDVDCSPCLSSLNRSGGGDVFFSEPFQIVSPEIFSGEVFELFGEDSLVVHMVYSNKNLTINKYTVFSANSFVVKHSFSVSQNTGDDNSFSVHWLGGIRDSELNRFEEITYSAAYVGQNKEISDLSITPSQGFSPIKNYYSESPDWVAIRNKYFVNSLISKDARGGYLGATSLQTASGYLMPEYSMGLSFGSAQHFDVNQYFGPLDVDLIKDSNTYLDRIMSFGWLIIQPFSRSVLWLLKALHGFGVNYGVVLIIFALLIRVVTGPLTKQSFKSSQNMQKIQPEIKKIQEKFKNDKQRLNREMMNLYSSKGVNPLGGCLPMLIQMPLLFSLFIVFRSTIEFRGAPFVFWINNLSQPDTVFNLPFNIPVYGNQVAFLPVVLGLSMFLSQKLTMETMDPKQKPIMYMMSVFFFLIFNSFPSGLNLYYVMYNLLNYQQQRAMKKGT